MKLRSRHTFNFAEVLIFHFEKPKQNKAAHMGLCLIFEAMDRFARSMMKEDCS